jgi:hypothetical protein
MSQPGPEDTPEDLADYVGANARERERLRRIVEGLSDQQLALAANDSWTVAGVLGHIAFWDGRVLALAARRERGVPFSGDDDEPEDVDWINDASAPLIHAIEVRRVAELALRIAEATDGRVESLPAEVMWPADPRSPINAVRAGHRRVHLDEIESALRRNGVSLPEGRVG